MKSITLFELGYFTETEARKLSKMLDNSTYMHFHVFYSKVAGNCTLIINTDYEDTPENIKNFFMSYAIHQLASYGKEDE